MRIRTIGLITAIAIGCLASGASAQDDPKVGVTMGYPASIGVIWQVTDWVALRPEVSVAKSSSEFTTTTSLTTFSGSPFEIPVPGATTTTTTVNRSDAWQASVGLSALFYVSKRDALRTYLSPRWMYTRLSSNSGSSIVGTGSTSSVNFVSGSFGAQYALARRFSVYGEVGLGFTRTVNSPAATVSVIAIASTTSSALATRSGAGVILYF
jgi:hypothetical protein